ncbi:MAG: enolase [Chloroflexi bacterium]|nr:enolase [Chloroflexota bacterium]
MKVTRVERFFVDVPFREIAERNMARALAGWHISEICRVETDAGLTGIGETLPNYTWGVVTEAAIDRVIGRNPFEVMWDDSLGAGLQMALFDVAGKAAGVPCYRLLGHKVRDWCPIAWWSIDMPPADFAAELKIALAEGYVAAKQKARPWFDVFAQVAADREVIPPYFSLDLDFNGLLVNAANAVPVIRQLDECPNVAIYESPIPQGDVEGNRRIRASTRCAIAMHYGSPPIMTAIREQVCDGFVIGGGASAVLRQAQVAREANMPFWLQLVGTGLTTAFALHLGAVCTHAQWPAVTCLNIYQHQLLRRPLEVKGGCIRVPEEPGLGIELDEEACQRFRVPTSHHPNLRAIYAVHRPNGDRTYYVSERQYWDDYAAGNAPVAEPGTWLETIPDDGSTDWTELYERARSAPVRSHGQP